MIGIMVPSRSTGTMDTADSRGRSPGAVRRSRSKHAGGDGVVLILLPLVLVLLALLVYLVMGMLLWAGQHVVRGVRTWAPGGPDRAR